MQQAGALLAAVEKTPTMAGKSLAAKLAEVMGAVGRIAKSGRNEFHKYDYVTEADIVEAIRLELASRQIILLPGILSHERVGVGEKGSVLTTILMEFTFHDGETGQEIKRPWMGAGSDKEDKGLYKAMTGAEKYFLMKTFLIPTGDDPEKDGPADKGKKPEKPKDAAPKPPAAQRVGFITEAHKQELWALARKLFPATAATQMKAMLAIYKVEKTEDLPLGPDPKDPLAAYDRSLSYLKELEDEKAGK